MRTRPGFFTALLFRNIFFDSAAFLDRPEFLSKYKFSTLDEWVAYVCELRMHFKDKPEDFFCNPSAYGQHVANRTIEQGEHLWDVSERCEWPTEWPVSFKDMYALIQRIKLSFDSREGSATHGESAR